MSARAILIVTFVMTLPLVLIAGACGPDGTYKGGGRGSTAAVDQVDTGVPDSGPGDTGVKDTGTVDAGGG